VSQPVTPVPTPTPVVSTPAPISQVQKQPEQRPTATSDTPKPIDQRAASSGEKPVVFAQVPQTTSSPTLVVPAQPTRPASPSGGAVVPKPEISQLASQQPRVEATTSNSTSNQSTPAPAAVKAPAPVVTSSPAAVAQPALPEPAKQQVSHPKLQNVPVVTEKQPEIPEPSAAPASAEKKDKPEQPRSTTPTQKPPRTRVQDISEPNLVAAHNNVPTSPLPVIVAPAPEPTPEEIERAKQRRPPSYIEQVISVEAFKSILVEVAADPDLEFKLKLGPTHSMSFSKGEWKLVSPSKISELPPPGDQETATWKLAPNFLVQYRPESGEWLVTNFVDEPTIRPAWNLEEIVDRLEARSILTQMQKGTAWALVDGDDAPLLNLQIFFDSQECY
jgi:hypothetical protein